MECMVDNRTDIIRHTKKKGFISAFAKCGFVNQAAKISKVHRSTHYAWMKNDQDYAERFEEAKQEYIEILEFECDRRAVEGVKEPVFYKGKIVGHQVKYSDNLLMFRLKKLNPSYRDGAPVQVNQNQAVQVNENIEEQRERVAAMILKAQEIDGGVEPQRN